MTKYVVYLLELYFNSLMIHTILTPGHNFYQNNTLEYYKDKPILSTLYYIYLHVCL